MEITWKTPWKREGDTKGFCCARGLHHWDLEPGSEFRFVYTTRPPARSPYSFRVDVNTGQWQWMDQTAWITFHYPDCFRQMPSPLLDSYRLYGWMESR